MDNALAEERLTLTVEEACKRLGIGRSLGYELARQGQLPTLRLGRKLVVPAAALQRMLENTGQREDSEQ